MRNDPNSLNLHSTFFTAKAKEKKKREKKSAWGEGGEGEGKTVGFFNSDPGCNSKYKLSQNKTAKFSLFCQQRQFLSCFTCYISFMKTLEQQHFSQGGSEIKQACLAA